MIDRQVVRENSDFFCGTERCAAWLYRPKRTDNKPPVVVMAHGFAGERTFRLPAYARVFAERGMAVLLFDYRHFGDSEGEPRNLVDHRRQHRDWLAAILHAKTIDGIDAERIALWGSSFSGGHVLSIAAEKQDVRAIVAQAPMVDMVRALRVSPKFAAAAIFHATRDLARAVLGLSPHYIPIVAPPDQFAALNTPGCDPGYRAIVPDNSGWKNQCTARSLLSSLFFRPGRKASLVTCPAMFVIAERDQVIRAREIERVAKAVPHSKVIRYPVDHFEIYQGQVFEEISRAQADFLARHLGISNDPISLS